MTALAAGSASAECPGVEIAFRGDRWVTDVQQATAAELELETERAGLCGGGKRASVLLVWQGSEAVGIAVDLVRDDGTELQLRRKVDSTRIPPDGLSLAIAAVVGELLREARPPEVRPAAEPEAAAAPLEKRLGVGLRASGAGGAGTLRGGGELFGRFTAGRFGVQLALGGGGGAAFAGSAGTVEVRLLTAALTGLVRLFGGETWGVSVEAGAAGGPWWLTAAPREGYAGSSALTWSIAGRAGLDAAVRLGALALLVSAGVDIPIRGVAVTDGTERLVSPVGVAGYLTLGAAFTW